MIPPAIPTRRRFLQGAAGAAALAAYPQLAACQRLNDSVEPLSAAQFGAVGDGATDDTEALVRLFAAMQESGRPGVLGHGAATRYVLKTGALAWTFDNGSTVAPPGVGGPVLQTNGKVTLVARKGSPDAPFISIHNDRRRGGRYIHGGMIGTLEFEDKTGDGAIHRHGIELYGVEAMTFAPLFSAALQGDLVHVSPVGDALTGDDWHVFQCVFESLTTWNTGGWTLNNDSLSQFFNFNRIGQLWNIGCARGAWRGAGAANSCSGISVAYCRGWAVDLTVNQGSAQTNRIGICELDGPEYGLRVNGVGLFDIEQMRVVHRYREFGGQQQDQSAWPKVAISLGGNDGKVTSDGRIRAFHYLKTGITPQTVAKLGLFVDLNNDPNVGRIEIDNRVNPVLAGVHVDPLRLIGRVHRAARGLVVRFDGGTVVSQ